MVEGGGRFGGERDFGHIIEGNAELEAVRGAFFTTVIAGTKDELAKLLLAAPQRRNGKLQYLLTSGMAVELITGYERQHHDLDIVLFGERSREWEILGTDNVTPQRYWANMRFDPKFLESTALKAPFITDGMEFKVEIVHPVVIMAQKLSEAFSREPRDKDVLDAMAVFHYWIRKNGGNRNATWINFVDEAINSLPRNQKSDTVYRIKTVVEKRFSK